jgi:tetratricopeptide (TPR) repeat protein
MLDTLYSLSIAFKDLEQPKEELKTVDEIIALDPNFPGGWALKGNTLERLQRYEEAVTAFTRALDIDNRDAFLW